MSHVSSMSPMLVSETLACDVEVKEDSFVTN